MSPPQPFRSGLRGHTKPLRGTVSSCDPGLITVHCAEIGGELRSMTRHFSVGQRVWSRCDREGALGKQPVSAAASTSCVAPCGSRLPRQSLHLPDQRPATGKLVTVFARTNGRTSEAAIDWSDEVFVSWGQMRRCCCSH